MHSKRDLRIDFFRGLALLIVLVDHIEGWAKQSVVEQWTLISLGFSDAAEIFIFLSGYVLASAYSSTLERDGLAGCVKKAIKRSAQIYVAYVIAAMAVLIGGALCMRWEPPLYNDFFRIGDHFLSSALAVATLRFHPWGFDVLALYVVLLPVMAVMFYLLRRAPEVAWMISITAYVLAQWNPTWNLPRFGDYEPWYFNPLAWQLLFFIGMYLGDPLRKPLRVGPRWLWSTLSVGMLVAGFGVLKVIPWLVNNDHMSYDDGMSIIHFYWDWANKTTLEPLRLLHFFGLVYLTSLWLPKGLTFWSSRFANPLVVAGQHSLEVYACGLVVGFWAAFAVTRGLNSAAQVIAIDAVACVVSLFIAYVIRWWKQPATLSPPVVLVADGQGLEAVQAPKTGASSRRRSATRPRRKVLSRS